MSLAPPDGWLVCDPSDPSTDLMSTWWSTYVDFDPTVFESGFGSIIFKPTAAVSPWLVSGNMIPVNPGDVLRASARFMTDDVSTSESLFRLGFAFYDVALDYLDTYTVESYGFAGNDLWWDHTAIARINSIDSNSRFARLVFGRHSTAGDTNTIWVDSVDANFEPNLSETLMVGPGDAGQTISGTGETLIELDAAGADAEEGLYLDVSTGELVIQKGGTWVLNASIDFTTTNGAKVEARLYRKVTTSGGTTTTLLRKGADRYVVTGDLDVIVDVQKTVRLDTGDRIQLKIQTSATGQVNIAYIDAVRIGA